MWVLLCTVDSCLLRISMKPSWDRSCWLSCQLSVVWTEFLSLLPCHYPRSAIEYILLLLVTLGCNLGSTGSLASHSRLWAHCNSLLQEFSIACRVEVSAESGTFPFLWQSVQSSVFKILSLLFSQFFLFQSMKYILFNVADTINHKECSLLVLIALRTVLGYLLLPMSQNSWQTHIESMDPEVFWEQMCARINLYLISRLCLGAVLS